MSAEQDNGGKDINRELARLQIRYKQIQNELLLVQKENEENSARYAELLKELSLKNEELESLKNNLEDIVEAKTAELVKAKKEAEDSATEARAATAAKSDFLANMSHEIRTPLNGVIGIIDLLARTELNELQKEYISDLSYSSDMLMSLVNNVLDLSKIEAGKLEFEFKPFQLKNMLSGLCNVMKYRAKGKGVALELALPEKLPDFVVGDVFRVRQVLMNLVSNAIKFTIEGKIEISVEIMEKNDAGVLLLFSVSDTGIGIPEEKMPLLFEKFSQADASVTRKFGGTGLGLAICKMLVERMGGRVYVKNREDAEGSVFSFTLPLEILEEIIVEHEKGAPGAWKRPPEVLLAEDNMINRKIAVAFLKDFGCKVDCAENGLEASNKFRDKNYDIVFMDIQMPVMDGLEAARVMRKMEKKEGSVPIIALTANAVDAGRSKCAEAGMNDHLTKPIDKKALSSSLLKYLSPLLEKKAGESKKTDADAESPQGIFDENKAFALLDCNKALTKELLEYFINSTPEMMRELADAIEKQDLVSGERLAHTLKGTGRNLALGKFADTALEIEIASEKGKLDKARSAFQKLESDFDAACKAIAGSGFMKS